MNFEFDFFVCSWLFDRCCTTSISVRKIVFNSLSLLLFSSNKEIFKWDRSAAAAYASGAGGVANRGGVGGGSAGNAASLVSPRGNNNPVRVRVSLI